MSTAMECRERRLEEALAGKFLEHLHPRDRKGEWSKKLGSAINFHGSGDSAVLKGPKKTYGAVAKLQSGKFGAEHGGVKLGEHDSIDEAAHAVAAAHAKQFGEAPEKAIPGATAIVKGKAGRYVKLNGKQVHIPHHDDFSRKVGDDTFTSPGGTTAVYKNDAPYNAPKAVAQNKLEQFPKAGEKLPPGYTPEALAHEKATAPKTAPNLQPKGGAAADPSKLSDADLQFAIDLTKKKGHTEALANLQAEKTKRGLAAKGSVAHGASSDADRKAKIASLEDALKPRWVASVKGFEGSADEDYEFDSEKEADAFISKWISQGGKMQFDDATAEYQDPAETDPEWAKKTKAEIASLKAGSGGDAPQSGAAHPALAGLSDDQKGLVAKALTGTQNGGIPEGTSLDDMIGAVDAVGGETPAWKGTLKALKAAQKGGSSDEKTQADGHAGTLKSGFETAILDRLGEKGGRLHAGSLKHDTGGMAGPKNDSVAWDDAAKKLEAEGKIKKESTPLGDHYVLAGSKTDSGPIPNYDKTTLKIGSSAGGTTGAKIATDAAGKKFLVKTYGGNQDRVATELAANALYRELGVKVPNAGSKVIDGKPALAYPLLDGEPTKITKPSSEFGRHFMADALVANWDFVGLTDDNVLWDKDGKPFRVDQGGTLQYRAQGAKKDFGPVPSEVWSMMTGGGQGVGKVKVTHTQKMQQAAEIAEKLTPEKIDAIMASAPFADDKMRSDVADSLKKRVAWMRAYSKGEKSDESVGYVAPGTTKDAIADVAAKTAGKGSPADLTTALQKELAKAGQSKPVTPQVPALGGMSPLGIKPTESKGGQGALISSPARSGAGNLRNFGAMKDDKLKNLWTDLQQHNKWQLEPDNEAVDAISAELTKRGISHTKPPKQPVATDDVLPAGDEFATMALGGNATPAAPKFQMGDQKMASPARSGSGNLRNFGAMGDEKLKGVWNDIQAFNDGADEPDSEAADEIQLEMISRGLLSTGGTPGAGKAAAAAAAAKPPGVPAPPAAIGGSKQPKPELNSPGRGPTGALRNFAQMSDAKLAKTLLDLVGHGGDPEAMHAAQLEAIKRRPTVKLKEAIDMAEMSLDGLIEADYSSGERSKMAKDGRALPDGSFPIDNEQDVHNAMSLLHHAKDQGKARAHIRKRAAALGVKVPSLQAQETALERRVARRVALFEAADSLAKASTPEPFSKSKTSNWVARGGGLPAYVQHIAHGLVEKRGMSESKAIQMAIGIVKRWARGGGNVDAGTRAAAAKAVAEWEALKAKNKAS